MDLHGVLRQFTFLNIHMDMHMASCLHIIAHMDMHMAPFLHIIADMNMDMNPCLHTFTLNLLSLTSRHISGYVSMSAYYLLTWSHITLCNQHGSACGFMSAYYHAHGAIIHSVITFQNLFTYGKSL